MRALFFAFFLFAAGGAAFPVQALSMRPLAEQQYQNAPGKRGAAVREPGTRAEAGEKVGPGSEVKPMPSLSSDAPMNTGPLAPPVVGRKAVPQEPGASPASIAP